MWKTIVATKPGIYANGDQKITLRVTPNGDPAIQKGEVLDLSRPIAPEPEPEPTPEPTPEPEPTPVPTPTPTPGARTLKGGWNFPFDYQRGATAIDYATMTLYMVGHSQRQEILVYNLPPMGLGTDESKWPLVFPSRIMPRFWGTGYAHGLCFWRGKLWVSTRVFYDQPPSSEEPLVLYAEDGETLELPSLKRQMFSGFVKTGVGKDPLLGGGGYESGQGTVSGPTLATLSGQVLLQYGWPGDPGGEVEGVFDPLLNWNSRAPREPNYTNIIGFTNLADPTPGYPGDSWVGWVPRTINGVLEGRWASDRIYGGGLALPEGITYYASMGTGELDYRRQTLTFGKFEDDRTYEYRYSPDGKFLSYAARPDLGMIVGQELGPGGEVYLTDIGAGWYVGPGSCVVRVFA